MATATGPSGEAATPTLMSYSLDLASSPVPGQIGYCILDLDGRIIVDGGQQSNSNNQSSYCTVVQDAPILFQMLQETTSILPPKSNDGRSGVGAENIRGFRRMTIDFDNATRYIIGRDSTHIYLIQTVSTS